METVEALKEEIIQLKELVKKQSKLLAQTGEQLLEIQVRQTSAELKALDPHKLKGSSKIKEDKSTNTLNPLSAGSITSAIDTSEFATNQDLVQLVGELQGQLIILEQRSIDRTANSFLTSPEDGVIPLTNADGDPPNQFLFPKTLQQFHDLKDDDLLQLCTFYELLPPNYQDEARMQAFIAGKIKTPNLEPGDYEITVDDYSKDSLFEFYVKLARYLGLKVKRSPPGPTAGAHGVASSTTTA
ncbi:unnamed protein product [Ambrosiozyma monospora]|uniref:Unnamed protein product n=1 Tax=Ambrosiozyma monospora TaxID=43982 RepID=A0A9W6YZ86_AMBMO|nr:unnamed protein product [Ambrosiozyma monospora]